MKSRDAVLAILAAAASATATPAAAAPRATTLATCAPSPSDRAVTVTRVVDDLDLMLADGRLVRLAGLAAPRASDPELSGEARDGLDRWLPQNRTVLLHPLASVPDRWNRIPAIVWPVAAVGTDAVPDAPAAVSAAQDLLAKGLARARPDPSVHSCFPAFLDAETAARTRKQGLWGDPHYAVVGAGDVDGLAGQAGDMVLVEGTLRVHESRGALYLTLGRDRWGFTAVVPRRSAERFAKGGFDPRDYAGTPVRLRGDLDTRFGARIELADPDQLESLEPGSEPVGSEAPRH